MVNSCVGRKSFLAGSWSCVTCVPCCCHLFCCLARLGRSPRKMFVCRLPTEQSSADRSLLSTIITQRQTRSISRRKALHSRTTRCRPPPRRVERERPIRYSDAERRRREINNERPLPRVDRNVVASRYDSRLRELEREVHALRAEREIAMRHTADRRPPPRDLRRDERERYAVSQRPPRRAARERYSDEN
jgi:hypothetical protein